MNFFSNIFTSSFKQHAPIITKRVKGNFCPWLVDETKQLMNQRDKVLRKFRKSKNEDVWSTYKTLRNPYINEIRKARSKYHQSLLIEHKDNTSIFWITIKTKFSSDKAKGSVLSESNQTKANLEFVWKPLVSITPNTENVF